MKRFFQKIPYNHQVTIVILVFTLIPCIVLGAIYLQSEGNEQKQSLLSDYYSYVDATATQASKIVTSLETKMDYLLYNYEIHSYLSDINELSFSQALDLIQELNSAAAIVSLDNSNITARWYPTASTVSYGEYCQTLDVLASEFPNGASDPVYQRILHLDGNELLWVSKRAPRQTDKQESFQDRLFLYSKFSTLDRTECIVELSLPVTDFLSTFEGGLPSGSLFAIRLKQNNRFEYTTLSSLLGAEESSSLLSRYEKTGSLPAYEIIQTPITNTDNGAVLLLLPKSDIDSLLRPRIVEILLLYALIAIIILCSCYLTSHFLTRKILRAIKEMRQDISTVITQSEEEDPIPSDIQRICTQVKTIVQNTQDYCHKIDLYEKESIRSALELLQMRFNPHLLYNTLAAVSYQTKEADTREAIVSLCNYYRVVLHNGYVIIKMHDEIEMVKEYLQVMKYTYCLDNIDYEFDIDEDVLQYTVMKHVLQPIVENAIHHGLRPLQQPGILRICGKVDGDCLQIQVIDNGIGMSPEETEKLLTEPANNTHGGYGIFNVQSRLQLHYGQQYGLTVESAKGKGTCVTMRIPKVLEE